MGFVFYDVETTGKHKQFDQILQFAAIHTDHDLNELDRFEIRCRLLPHVVPSPKALIVTHVSMDRILDPSLPSHYDMICAIEAKLTAWSPAIFVGWNSLDFDEHMLRQALYQCLHAPYLTNTNGNSRTDLMKFSQALSALQPGALVIPTADTGKLTFKLDLLAPANGFDHANAHDAMGDVEATLYICRLLRDCAGEHWSNVLRFSQRAAALAFMDEEPAFVITECYFGLPYQFALTKIGVDADNPKTVLAYDLEVDPAELVDLDHEALVKRLGKKIKPLRRIPSNASPILHEVGDFPSFHGLSPDQLMARAEAIRSDSGLCSRIAKAAERAAREPSVHVESRIYDTFSGEADRDRMAQFHASDWAARAVIVESFEDDRLVELGRRIVFHHEPSALSADVMDQVAAHLAKRMTGQGFLDVPWTTLAVADADAVSLLTDCGEEGAAIITLLRTYLAEQVAHCGVHLS